MRMRISSIASFVFLSAIPNAAAFHVSRVLGSKICARTSSSTVVNLFDDDKDMIPIAENYIHAKYQAVATSHGHTKCDKDDAREVLQAVLPPVTPAELENEVTKIFSVLMKNPKNSATAIDEEDFCQAIVQNTYWEEAGDLVVKELMYLDSLYSYYKTGKSLLANEDYEELKENLTWEGSSVPTMSGKEALFVTAVAAARRGRPLLNDAEYGALKEELKSQNSWVTSREADALEKLKIQTFMGYLHRALK